MAPPFSSAQLYQLLDAQPLAAGAPDLPSYRARGDRPPPPRTDESTGIDTAKIPR